MGGDYVVAHQAGEKRDLCLFGEMSDALKDENGTALYLFCQGGLFVGELMGYNDIPAK